MACSPFSIHFSHSEQMDDRKDKGSRWLQSLAIIQTKYSFALLSSLPPCSLFSHSLHLYILFITPLTKYVIGFNKHITCVTDAERCCSYTYEHSYVKT